VVDGLEGIDDAQMKEIARETEERCTVTIALRERVSVTSDIVSSMIACKVLGSYPRNCGAPDWTRTHGPESTRKTSRLGTR
jgi:hypothetical protein